MEHFILITAYKNVEHLYKIVDFFDAANSKFSFYIHLDKKSVLPEAALNKLREKACVKLVSRQYKVNWGGVNHLKAILLLIEEALKDSGDGYFHLITGHDFPVQPPEKFSAFFEENKEKEFLEYNKLPYSKWENGGFDRLLFYNPYDLFDGRSGLRENIAKKIIKIQKTIRFRRKLPLNFPNLYGGSTYWSLSRKCIEHIYKYVETHPEFLKRFDYTFCAEEIFFQTIILNSPFSGNAVNNNLRFIVWEKRNGNFPANLDESDYEAIKASGAFFARKFEYPVSERLLEKFESR
ncbi:MAG: beta-1,6-N-acetylglucosaminyltransferase [Prevotella sp.]|jgi:hypothetical protein|nr:beta-1,6-N-acetylglucosaminyltransferase [Prevotella sp.]